jgi:hypothetical protein
MEAVPGCQILMIQTIWQVAKQQNNVYGVDPDLTREGGSIPVTLTLQVEL